jgi:hypothetical protein
MLNEPGGAEAPAYGAHALLAQPRLAAATFWQRHPDLLGRTLEAVRVWPGVDDGWKQSLFAAMPPPQGNPEPIDWLALDVDTQGEETLSLPVFRRRPWPASWRLVQVRAEALPRLGQPPAAALPGTSPRAFASVPCRRRSLREQDLLTR